MINIKEIEEITKQTREKIKVELTAILEEKITNRAKKGETSVYFDLEKTQLECIKEYIEELKVQGFEIEENVGGRRGSTTIEWKV